MTLIAVAVKLAAKSWDNRTIPSKEISPRCSILWLIIKGGRMRSAEYESARRSAFFDLSSLGRPMSSDLHTND
jgi:hypothetical protein